MMLPEPEIIPLAVNLPEVVVTARVLEVSCGESHVAIHQVMSRNDPEWTVYEGSRASRYEGYVNKVDKAPTAEKPEALIPWAVTLVIEREREREAIVQLRRFLSAHRYPAQDHVDEQAPDQG